MRLIICIFIILITSYRTSVANPEIDQLLDNFSQTLNNMVIDVENLKATNARFFELDQQKEGSTSDEEKEWMDIWLNYRCTVHSKEYDNLIKQNKKNISILTFNDSDCKTCLEKNTIIKKFCKQHGIKFIVMEPIEYMSYKRAHNPVDDPLMLTMKDYFDPELKSEIIANLNYPIIVHYKSNLFKSFYTLGELEDSCMLKAEIGGILSAIHIPK